MSKVELGNVKKVHFLVLGVTALAIFSTVYILLFVESSESVHSQKDTLELKPPKRDYASLPIAEEVEYYQNHFVHGEAAVLDIGSLEEKVDYINGFSYYTVGPELGVDDKHHLDVFALRNWGDEPTLLAFVENLRSINLEVSDPFEKFVSEIQPVTINGNDGYRLDVISNGAGFVGVGSYRMVTEPTSFYFFESDTGLIIVSHLPLWEESTPTLLAQLNTLVIDSDIIPKMLEPADWVEVKREGFTYQYPSNLYEIEENDDEWGIDFIHDTKRDVYGGFHVLKHKGVFDPKNSNSKYGATGPEEINTGSKSWQRYTSGEAQVTWIIYTTNLANDTLEVTFVSSLGDLYPLRERENLQLEVLERFTFE